MANDKFEEERQRLIQLAKSHKRPCIVCDDADVIGIGTWVPDSRQRLAAGGSPGRTPIFAFWLCNTHMEQTDENDKFIRQAVLRSVR